MADPFLSIQHVQKVLRRDHRGRRTSTSMSSTGEFVSFLGPSGCGKTTVLRMVAGFEEPTSGTIIVGGKDVTRLKPNQRNIGMVFQAYALFPNLTVAQNIGFGLKVAGAVQGRHRRARRRDARPHQAAAVRRPLSLPAFRRPAAARGAGPRARAEAQAAAARRAAVGARRQGARFAARRNPRDPEGARHHHHLRHARPGRGAVDLRPHRRHVWRQGRAGRHAVRDLQPPGDQVRRQFRRHAQRAGGHRHRRRRRHGAGRRQRASCSRAS